MKELNNKKLRKVEKIQLEEKESFQKAFNQIPELVEKFNNDMIIVINNLIVNMEKYNGRIFNKTLVDQVKKCNLIMENNGNKTYKVNCFYINPTFISSERISSGRIRLSGNGCCYDAKYKEYSYFNEEWMDKYLRIFSYSMCYEDRYINIDNCLYQDEKFKLRFNYPKFKELLETEIGKIQEETIEFKKHFEEIEEMKKEFNELQKHYKEYYKRFRNNPFKELYRAELKDLSCF